MFCLMKLFESMWFVHSLISPKGTCRIVAIQYAPEK